MSLFGTSPDDPQQGPSAAQPKLLFDNESAGTPKPDSNSLFADEANTDQNSPWALPTPKKADRGEIIKTLLPVSAVPESYINAFHAITSSGSRVGTNISIEAVKNTLESSNISSSDQSRLLELIAPSGTESAGLGRNEFNVLLALVGLAQEGEDATLDEVHERRKRLPEPSIPYLERLKTSKTSESIASINDPSKIVISVQESDSFSKARRVGNDSLEDPEADPWGVPAVHKTHAQNQQSNGAGQPQLRSSAQNGPVRTTSVFTTYSLDRDPTVQSLGGSTTAVNSSTGTDGSGWGYINPTDGLTNGDPTGLSGAGFSSGADNLDTRVRPSRALRGGRATSRAVEDIVTVTLLPDKEGMFMFQHRNYEVNSARRASSVIRRYSDFVWLLDCLHKRYPFRQLPLLPPKRVSVNGRHLGSDSSFIEKRRRGLVRFTNALIRHPVLCQEQLVVMFLTVPTELAVWRKQATISVQEEFVGKALPPGLEDSLSVNLMATFDTVRAGVRRSADAYIHLCVLVERLTKRNQGVAADSYRFSQALTALTDESESTYAIDNNDVPSLNEGINSTARHLESSQALLEDEARAWDLGILEDLKAQRDCLVSVRDMFDRRDRFAKDNIPQLERRIESNETKLAQLRAKPEGIVKPGEQEKVEQAISSDKQSIISQHARSVFIKECVRDELLFFQQSQYHVSKLHQDWSLERVKYSELHADNWRALSEEMENMPTGD